MEPKKRVKVNVCANGAANDELDLDELMASRDPLDPRLLAIARIIARQAAKKYVANAANDNEPGNGTKEDPP